MQCRTVIGSGRFSVFGVFALQCTSGVRPVVHATGFACSTDAEPSARLEQLTGTECSKTVPLESTSLGRLQNAFNYTQGSIPYISVYSVSLVKTCRTYSLRTLRTR